MAAQPKKIKQAPLPTASSEPENAFVVWADTAKGRDIAEKALSDAVEGYQSIRRQGRSVGKWHQDLSNLTTNVSGRPGLTRSDYDKFRPDEAVAGDYSGIMKQADNAYIHVGMIRNIIDLMADFACQGIRVVHPNKKIERFYKNWFKRVDGIERSERFLNYLYRLGNVVIKRQTAEITLKEQNKLYRATSKPRSKKPDIKIEEPDITLRVIPWKYTYLNPANIGVKGGALASFVAKPVYTVKLSAELARTIRSPKDNTEKALVEKLPKEIREAAEHSRPYELSPDNTSVYYYKKDDWRPWAYPMIHAILDDIKIIEKLKLADVAAIDGVIANVRIFKLGNLEHKIAPKKAAATKLANILENNVGGGTMDIVWGPDLELLETKTSTHEFLGEAKYKPHLNSVYSGLGIPPTLTGTFGNTGTTNNFISLKTLVRRLEYGRMILKGFWTEEIELVRRAMSFRLAASVEFDMADLGDEIAEKALLIQLADRDLISEELLQLRFGSSPNMEKIRQTREQKEREVGQRPMKAGPFHDPQFGIALKKLAMRYSNLKPEQMGLNVNEKRESLRIYENPDMLDVKNETDYPPPIEPSPDGNSNSPDDKKGVPQQGRPTNVKDSGPRKEKTFTPKMKAESQASLEIWTRGAQNDIATILHDLVLEKYNKKNMRSLTAAELLSVENMKFGVLYHLEPFSMVNQSAVHGALLKGNISKSVKTLYYNWIDSIHKQLGHALTIDELRHVQCNFYTYLCEEGEI